MAGKRARVAGVQLDRHLLVLDKGRLQLEAAGSTISGSGGTVVAATQIQGNQNTLSILVNFSDAAVTCNATDVASRLFGATGPTVNNNYPRIVRWACQLFRTGRRTVHDQLFGERQLRLSRLGFGGRICGQGGRHRSDPILARQLRDAAQLDLRVERACLHAGTPVMGAVVRRYRCFQSRAWP